MNKNYEFHVFIFILFFNFTFFLCFFTDIIVRSAVEQNANFQMSSNGNLDGNEIEKNSKFHPPFPSSSSALNKDSNNDSRDNNKKINNDNDVIVNENKMNTLSDLDFGVFSTPVADKNDTNDAYNDFDQLFNSIADSNIDIGNVAVIFNGDEIVGLSYEGKKFLKSLPDYSFLTS